MVAPILPIELKDIAFNPELLGYIFTSYSLTSAVSTLVCGATIHITGRKTILVISILIMGISSVLFSFLLWMPSKALIISVCFIVRIIEGFSAGITYCAVNSITVIVFKEKQVEYLSYIVTSEAITIMIAPVIGSTLYVLFGFQILFIIVAVSNFLIALTVFIFVPKEVDITYLKKKIRSY